MTERVIKILKYEWLKRVAIIKGYDHIEKFCNTFMEWYNEWWPHYRLDGNTPDDVFTKHRTTTLDQKAKTNPFATRKKAFPRNQYHGISNPKSGVGSI